MKINQGFFLFLSTIAWMFISSCAQVVAPGGGPIDKTPPRALKYIPDSARLNFNTRSIQIVFDEYIVLKDLNGQLLISPPLEFTPEIEAKNKTLVIELDKKEVLKPNTTYSIHFGTSLQDLNENNPKENFNYIFSTGNYIDSLEVKGKVRNAFDHKTEKGMLVMLYKNTSDSIVFKNQPDYFTRTNADGNFVIRNIAPGNYKIFSLKDQNANYRFDAGETLGFRDSLVDPSSDESILLNSFTEPEGKTYIKKYMHDQYGKFTLIFSKGTDSILVNNISNDKKGVQEIFDYSAKRDTLVYWVKNYEKDSLLLEVRNGSQIMDTLFFKFIKFEDAIKAKRNPLKLRLNNSPDGNQSFNLNSPVVLTFSQPVTSLARNGSILREDTVVHKDNATLGFNSEFGRSRQQVYTGTWDSLSQAEWPVGSGTFVDAPTFNSQLSLKENTKYELFIPPGTFTDFFGLTNDTIRIKFKTREQKFYGSVKLKLDIPKVKDEKGSYIVQLLDEKENVVRENLATGATELVYEYLHPGKYKLKIIFDENGNQKWDEGDYIKKRQPEQVIYNAEIINIRSNWDADLDWKTH
ncbi:MAG: Ig-like domain-containing domain [Bacteroidota bacterium]|nr:Ig-like domain-containing domain [Bacteroidota bacterium]